MSDKVFVGRRCVSVSKPPELAPISKIILWIDSDNCFEVGDDSGRKLEITCPYGTQTMAEDLLQKLGGYVYRPLEATSALLDPAAEIGDAVTVDGRYTILASMELSFNSLMPVNISAPAPSELPQEYSFSNTEKVLNRKIASTRSLISKTAEEIRLEVANDIEGLSSSVTIELDSIRQEVQGAEDSISYLEVDLDAISGRVQDAEGNIGDLQLASDEFGVRLEDAEGNITRLELSTEEIEASVGDVSLRVSSLEGLTITDASGTTQLNGSRLATNSVYANSMHLGGALTVYKTQYGSTIGGYLGYDSGFNSTAGIGIRSAGERSQVVCTENAARISYGDAFGITQVVCGENTLTLEGLGNVQMSVNGVVRITLGDQALAPAYEYLALGTPTYGFYDVYAAGTSMGDLLRRVEELESAATAS